MLTRNVSKGAVLDAAANIGVEVRELREVGRTGLRFTLAPMNGRYQRRSASCFNGGRKVHAVCWHGHRVFFRYLFARSPMARVQTSFTRRFVPGGWYTAANFEDTHTRTDVNIGAPIAPVYYSEACDC